MHTHALDYVRHRLPAPEPSVLRNEAVVTTLDSVDPDASEEEAEHEEEARRFGHVKVPMATVVYDRRPGNHLDVQVKPCIPQYNHVVVPRNNSGARVQSVLFLSKSATPYRSTGFVICVSFV